MDKILNITNGDCAVDIMKQANITGAILPWRDVLHEGPVPKGLSLEQLSEVRAQFIIDQGWGNAVDIKNIFIDRDNILKSFNNYEKIILWFEHDLYDQLQILQLLDFFSQQSLSKTKLSMICTDQYLGMLSADEMIDLFEYEEAVTDDQLKLSNKAWLAFRSESPDKWHNLLNTDTSVLPFLKDAVIRMLEEYPDCINGLSRTAQQALKIISKGEKRPGKVFGLYQKTEDRRFLGDSSFWAILNELLGSNPPLLIIADGTKLNSPISPDQELTITQTGHAILDGEKNWLDLVDLDRWVGGVHLTSKNIWCWNTDSARLVKKSSWRKDR